MKWENVEYIIHWKEQEIYAVLEVYNKEMYPIWPADSQPSDTTCPIKPINLNSAVPAHHYKWNLSSQNQF